MAPSPFSQASYRRWVVRPFIGHLYQDEWFYIVDGHFLFEADGKNIHAGAGDSVFRRRVLNPIRPRLVNFSKSTGSNCAGHLCASVKPRSPD